MVTKDDLLAGRYRMQDDIARGGMGRVIAAHDERLHRQVAVKLLKDELVQDPRFVERFRREARAVAALSHPNVATVFDYGEDDECHFIVMEYAEGKDLARVLREDGPMSVDRATRIAGQVCNALAHAHTVGVVHRDVKPANIIIGSADKVKVTDFGIARAVGDTSLTATGSVLGTAQYISPEQAAGEEVTPATDVYSLGIVLYEMLTGAVPFTGDSPVAVAMQQVNVEMPVPSSLNSDVPGSLDEVVARATQKDPAARYADATEMGAAITAATADTADAGIVGPGDAPTLVDETPTLWPVAGSRWNPQRVGRWVLMILGALAVIALLLLAIRLAGSVDDAAPTRNEAPAEPATVTIPQEIIGVPYDDAKAMLEGLDAGLQVSRRDDESDAEKDTVVGSIPEPLTEVKEGSAVTLLVSSGDDDKEEDNGGGNGQGKGKKGKGDGGDD